MKHGSRNPRKKQQRRSEPDQKSVLGHEIYQRAVEAAPNAMVIADAKRKIALVNVRTEQLFGYLREELIGKEIESLVPECFRAKHPGHVHGFFQDPKARSMGAGRDLFGLRKDGTEIPIEIGLSSMETSEGLFTLASIIDITERKRAEESLRRLAAVVTDSNDAITLQDLEGKISAWNRGAEKMYGYTESEAQAMNIQETIPEAKRQEALEFMKRAQEEVPSFETQRLTKDGRTLDVWLTVTKLVDGAGKSVGIATTERDITERKRAIERLVEEKKNLERVNLELDSFVYTASHDLRAPLRAMSSYATFLEEDCKGQLDEKREKYLVQIRKGADRMNELIEDLLTLSRLSRIQNPYEEVKIRELLDSVLDRIEFDLKEMKVDLRIQDEMPTVYCDRIKIGEVFLNLINNAIKFSSKTPHETPRLEIGWRDQSESYEFYVKDNGIGIDPEYHEKIFGIFEKLHLREEYEGTGIGLSIVKRIVEDHSGRVWVESGVGKGAAFYFAIPKDLRKRQKKKLGQILLEEGLITEQKRS